MERAPEEILAKWDEDSLSHKILRKAETAIDLAMKTVGMRGHDPDAAYEQEERAYERGVRHGRRMAPKMTNGDEEGVIKRWHLVLAVLGVAVPAVGSAWLLSLQITSQFSSQATQIAGIREHQKEQDERTTRIEQQLQQIPHDRR